MRSLDCLESSPVFHLCRRVRWTAWTGLLTVAASALVAIAAGAGAAENMPVAQISAGQFSVRLSAEGRIIGATLGEKQLPRSLSGETILAGCRREGEVTFRKLKDGSVTFQSRLVHPASTNSCILLEHFSPTRNSLRWELEIRGEGGPWSTEILTQLGYPASPQIQFWAAWADRGTKSGWTDPLTPMPLRDDTFHYGAPPFQSNNPRLGWCPFDADIICLPLVSVLEPGADTGVSLVLSPEDSCRELELRTTASGGFVFSRANHRIDARRPVKFAMDLIVHEADWRGSLRWITARYPQFFDPANPRAHEMAGTGAYSCQDIDFDAEKMKKMAFRVNWRASFDFPYMGMFIPPVADNEPWTRFGGQKTSLASMENYAAGMRKQGFHVLSYFNVTEFGAHVTWPLPARKALRDEDLWKDCHDFLQAKLLTAILRIPERVAPEVLARSIYPRSQPGGCYFTWEDGIVMDCGDPAYRDFLLDQARRHIEKVPQSSGICIDRLDWMRLYNERADDGASWFEGRPARSLMDSWNILMDRLGPLMHSAGKVVFVNNHYKRLDLLRHADGIFDEFTYAPAPLNLTALLTLRKPALGWTDQEDALKPDPDAFFQRYLHLGVFPMAPFPGNDHSLHPSAWVDQQYLDYGPLLDALRGKKWVLLPRCVEASENSARVNLFEVPGGYVIPVTSAGKASAVQVTLRGVPGLSKKTRCEALQPGREKGVPVTATFQGKAMELDVPVLRGCAMVRLNTGTGAR